MQFILRLRNQLEHTEILCHIKREKKSKIAVFCHKIGEIFLKSFFRNLETTLLSFFYYEFKLNISAKDI